MPPRAVGQPGLFLPGTGCCGGAAPTPQPSPAAGRWAVPGGNPGVIGRLAAAPASATASGLKFPGTAITAALFWALSSPARGGQASEIHSFPLIREGEGMEWIRSPRSLLHRWRGRNMDFDGEGVSPEPPLRAQLCPPPTWGAWTAASIRACGGISPLKHILTPNSPLASPSYLHDSRMGSHQREAKISRKICK